MFVLCTDFGLSGPYMGQLHAELGKRAPGVAVINLFADLPRVDARSAAYLLAAYSKGFGANAVFVCVVDPGVGGEREIVVLNTPHGRFIGPDNGVLAGVAKQHVGDCEAQLLRWRPESSSATFHGRDIMAPAAAMLMNGEPVAMSLVPVDRLTGWAWPEDSTRVVYIDHYGNAITGMRAQAMSEDTIIRVADRALSRARTFADRPVGEAFWYVNSNGLVEIAVNQGRADVTLGLAVGSEFSLA